MIANRTRWLLVSLIVASAAPLGAQQVSRTLPGTKRDTAVARPVEPAQTVAPRAYGVIDGLVTDTNLTPLTAARVTILRTSLQVATGTNGRFRIVDVPVGQYIIIIRRAGYDPTSQVLEVTPKDTLRLSYTLTQGATQLAPVVVAEKRLSPRMSEFEARRKRGEGEFMTAEQIEQHNPAYPTEMLRLFSSISVQATSGGGGQYIYYPVSARATGGGTPTGQATCFMTVFVDNVPMPSPFSLDLLPSPREVAGIEVYAGAATMPNQYAGLGRGCGIILVWTKDGFSAKR